MTRKNRETVIIMVVLFIAYGAMIWATVAWPRSVAAQDKGILWDGEGSQSYIGMNGAIRGGIGVGGAHGGEYCFVGTPGVPQENLPASLRVNGDPPVLQEPYISFWSRASAPVQAWIAFQYFDEHARVSNRVPFSPATEWQRFSFPLSEFVNTEWIKPRILDLMLYSDRIGVDLYLDDLINEQPEIVIPPPPVNEGTAIRWHVTFDVYVTAVPVGE